MPTVLEINGYKFRFFSNENDEPAHVHVTRGSGNAKIWLEPTVKLEYSYKFTIRENRDIWKLVTENLETLKKAWYGHFA